MRNKRLFPVLFSQVSETLPWYLAGGAPSANLLAAYQPKGAASLAASYVNLANPGTYDAAPGTAPAFDAATGWAGGSNAYLRTGIVVNTKNFSAFVRFSDAPSATEAVIGNFTANNGRALYLRPNITNTVAYGYAGTLLVTPAPGLASGVIGVAGPNCYRNGAGDGTITQDGTDGGTAELILIGINVNGTPTQFFNGKIQAAVVYNTVLSPAQVLAISTAMAAL